MNKRVRSAGWSGAAAVAVATLMAIMAEAGAAEAARPAAKAGTAEKNATAKAAAPEVERVLFDGKSMAGWVQSGFEGETTVRLEKSFRGEGGAIVIEAGTTLNGITWTRGGELPRMNYEIALETMKLAGGDFFCGLTFPIGREAATLILGGWGGTLVGVSSIDNNDASENETTQGMAVDLERWYRLRVRVTEEKLEIWLDAEKIVDFETAGRKFSLRPGDIQKSLPLGIATFMTKAAVRNIRIRRL
jgi:hypothetical protein